ncbi:hypothetical protein BDV12DRAFT_187489 [Aspergillus spectabilis]
MAYSTSLSPANPHCLPHHPPPIPCSLLITPKISGAEILSISGTEVPDYPLSSEPPPASATSLPSALSTWNTRYLATGGGGFAAGSGDRNLIDPVSQGYATSSTDGRLTLNHTLDPQTGEWALRPDGSYNEDLVINLVYRSIHDTAEISKDLITQFYGHEASFSYYSGCSAGGRQGYASVSNYPGDFDGILATAPALYAPEFVTAALWPALVMRNTETPPFCVFKAYEAAILVTCDPLDGVKDGLISHHDLLDSCLFNTSTLIGKEVPCPQLGANSTLHITVTHAEMVNKILEGPITPDGESLWHGVAPGVSFAGMANTTTLANGTSIAVPFAHAEPWINYEVFFETFNLSLSRMGSLYGNQALNLTTFARGKGKVLTWYGLADESIPPLGMVDFRHGIEEQFGGSRAVDVWFRLFFAPGVAHCRGGYGPSPDDPLNVLVEWVEIGTAPNTLFAKGVDGEGLDVTRELCLFPQRLVYTGGDVRRASSFVCK